MSKFILALMISSIALTCLADDNTINSKTLAASATIAQQPAVVVLNGIKCDSNTPCGIVSTTSKAAVDLINNDKNDQLTDLIINQFDFTLMTKYAMGTNWKLADKNQQTQLVTLFRKLLTFTYSIAVSRFKGAKVAIVSSTISSSGKTAAVITKITLQQNSDNNQPITVEYDLANTTGTWKAYDVKIETASLVTTYRNQFNDVIQTSKMDGLIKQLQTKVDSLQKPSNSVITTKAASATTAMSNN